METKNILLIIGVIALVFGAISYAFTVSETDSYAGGLVTDTDTSTPYRAYAFPLLIAGIVLIIVSAVMSRKNPAK